MPITSSSISSSEAPVWRRFAVVFVATAAAAFAALVAALVALDPYDTGRLGLVVNRNIPQQGPRTANVSRGRDPAFNAAIIGNSHIQLVMPEELNAATGFSFVSLIVPATGPREQLTLMRWFLRHHPEPAAIVIGLDTTWCTADPALPISRPFPFWLYDRELLAYATGLIRYSALERIPVRIGALFGRIRPARRDGFWDYDADYQRIGYGDPAFVAQKLAGERPTWSGNVSGPFPAAEQLRIALAALPRTTPVVLVRSPIYIAGQPRPGSDAEKGDQACRNAFVALARERPLTRLVDWSVDRPENRQMENYFDKSHFRAGIARLLEADIAAALRARNPR
jgi:hypothetical protein